YTIGADMPDHEFQNRGRVQNRVVIETFRDIARSAGNVFLGLGSHIPSVFPSRGLVGRKATAVSQHDRKAWMPIENSTKIKTGGTNGGVEWVADQIVQVIGLHTVGAGHIVWMHEDEGAKILGGRPQRLEARVVEILSHDIRGDHRSAQAKLCDRA